MEFAIAKVTFWESVGFNATHWRKSINGSVAMVHLPFAEALVPDIRARHEVTVYLSPSAELDSLLAGPEWSEADADA